MEPKKDNFKQLTMGYWLDHMTEISYLNNILVSKNYQHEVINVFKPMKVKVLYKNVLPRMVKGS